MTNKQKFIIGLAMVAIVSIAIIGIFTPVGRVVTNTVTESFSGITNFDSLTLGDNLIVGGDVTIGDDLVVTYPIEGFVAQANFTIATGTAKAVWTNSYGTGVLCSTGVIYSDATTFAPSIVIGAGVSTSATGYSVSLLASTTLATTTDTLTMTPTTAASFIVANGSSIVAAISDYTIGAEASTTSFGNWDIEFGFPCWMMGS